MTVASGRAVRCVLAAVAMLLAACAPAPADRVVAGPADEAVAVLPATSSQRADAPSLHATSVERVARQATVRIRTRGCGRLGTASAVAIGPRLLVTNRHVVQGADTLELNYWDGTGATADLRAVAVADDLALVRVSIRLPTVARLADADPADGEKVIIVGYPNGGEQTITRGSVVEYARLRSPADASPVMRMSASIVPGNSGGAVLDRTGALAGIVFGVETETGYGLAIPASAVDDLRDSGGRTPPAGC
ncbi:MAG: serine protease [Actinobacteria bacterium]|nr:serine protease [Actinomycetota bacterium]